MDNYLKSKVKKEEVELDEGGMARQVKHSKSRSTAVPTANRGDKSSKETKHVIKNLVRRSVVWDMDIRK